MFRFRRVCGSFLRRRTASQRSLSGISRSIRITSGCSIAANLQPYLEAAVQLEARLEHVQVVVVVFDVEHFGHVADSVLLTVALITSSLDHLVGKREQRIRNIKTERLSGLEVDEPHDATHRPRSLRLLAHASRWNTALASMVPQKPNQCRQTRSSTNPWESPRFHPTEICSKCPVLALLRIR